MKVGIAVASLLVAFPVWATNMKQSSAEGKLFGKEGNSFALEQASKFHWEEKAPFSSKEAMQQMESGNIADTPETAFIFSDTVQKNITDHRILNEEEAFIKNSEKLAEEGLTEGSIEEYEEAHFEVCEESAGPFPVEVTRCLHVDVSYEPESVSVVEICRGHNEKADFFWKSDAKKWCEKKEAECKQNPAIKTYQVHWSGSIATGYTAKAEWVHVDNAQQCKKKKKKEQKIPEKWEIQSEKWVYDGPAGTSFLENPDATLVEKTCLDSTPKIVHGKEVTKQCWKERLSFLVRQPKSQKCAALRENNCLEVKRQCLKEGPLGCALWQVTYKCLDKQAVRSFSSDPDSLFREQTDASYAPNQSFSAVVTELKLFEEMKSQMESAQTQDASKFPFFKGKKHSCSKSIADNLLYDCCFSFGGLAKDLKLSQCSEEEIALGLLREKEQCHYVGSHKEEFLDLWKSRNVHVFCCFPTKLARIFQENAREQLGLDWGSSKNPDCRGLYSNEIAKVDFTKLNLSEAYEKTVPDLSEKLQKKLEGFEKKREEKQ